MAIVATLNLDATITLTGNDTISSTGTPGDGNIIKETSLAKTHQGAQAMPSGNTANGHQWGTIGTTSGLNLQLPYLAGANIEGYLIESIVGIPTITLPDSTANIYLYMELVRTMGKVTGVRLVAEDTKPADLFRSPAKLPLWRVATSGGIILNGSANRHRLTRVGSPLAPSMSYKVSRAITGNNSDAQMLIYQYDNSLDWIGMSKNSFGTDGQSGNTSSLYLNNMPGIYLVHWTIGGAPETETFSVWTPSGSQVVNRHITASTNAGGYRSACGTYIINSYTQNISQLNSINAFATPWLYRSGGINVEQTFSGEITVTKIG